MRPVEPEELGGQRKRLVADQRVLLVRHPGDAAAAAEVERGRSPIQRSLVIAGNACLPGNVLHVREIRSEGSREARKFSREQAGNLAGENVPPTAGFPLAGLQTMIDETETGLVRGSGIDALIRNDAVQKILAVEHAVQADLKAIHVGAALRRYLKILEGIAEKIRIGIQFQQRHCLGTEAAFRNQVPRKGSAAGRVVDRNGLPRGIDRLRKIAAPIGQGRHFRSRRVDCAAAGSSVLQEELAVGTQYVRNPQRTGNRSAECRGVVGGLLRVLSVQGEGAGIEGRIALIGHQHVVEHGARTSAAIAECPAFHTVTGAAVHHHGFRCARTAGIGAHAGRAGIGRRSGRASRRIHIGALKAALRSGRRRGGFTLSLALGCGGALGGNLLLRSHQRWRGRWSLPGGGLPRGGSGGRGRRGGSCRSRRR